uniref:collectin-12-like n=1 Tax=Myxine glutinosa TaxID=7769 RepID=UPI00358EABFA
MAAYTTLDEEDENNFPSFKKFGISESLTLSSPRFQWSLKSTVTLLSAFCVVQAVGLVVAAYFVFHEVESLSLEISTKHLDHIEKLTQARMKLQTLDEEFAASHKAVRSVISKTKQYVNDLEQRLADVSTTVEKASTKLQQVSLIQESFSRTMVHLNASLSAADADRMLAKMDSRNRAARMNNLDNRIQNTHEHLSEVVTSLEVVKGSLQLVVFKTSALENVQNVSNTVIKSLVEQTSTLDGLVNNSSFTAAQNADSLREITTIVNTLQDKQDNTSTYLYEQVDELNNIKVHFNDQDKDMSNEITTMKHQLDLQDTITKTLQENLRLTDQHLTSMISFLHNLSHSCHQRLHDHYDQLMNLSRSLQRLKSNLASLNSTQMAMRRKLDLDMSNLSMLMEEMKLIDVKHADIIKNFTIVRGPPGRPGSKGDAGDPGYPGSKGDAAERGPTGLKGDPGAPGEKGMDGQKGPPGPRGRYGLKGKPGNEGIRGFRGLAGKKGNMGKRGSRGSPGPPGLQGVPGPVGPPGKQGPVGPRGPRGIYGPPSPVEDVKEQIEGCPAGWRLFSNHCYYFSNERLSWHDANETCMSSDAQLVIISSKEEQAWLLKNGVLKTYHIGLHDSYEDGRWEWVDGSLLSETRFGNLFQPDNWVRALGGNEDCASMNPNASWADVSCVEKLYYICEKQRT